MMIQTWGIAEVLTKIKISPTNVGPGSINANG
jgi:hypothetical protein